MRKSASCPCIEELIVRHSVGVETLRIAIRSVVGFDRYGRNAAMELIPVRAVIVRFACAKHVQ